MYVIKLTVSDFSPKGENRCLGSIVAQEGMETRMGQIVGFSETGKSVRIRLGNGFVKTIREMDRLPGVDVREARKWGFKG